MGVQPFPYPSTTRCARGPPPRSGEELGQAIAAFAATARAGSAWSK